MNKPNISWLFYKAYYNNDKIVWKEKSEDDKKANAAVFAAVNDKIFQQTLPDVLLYHYPEDAGLNNEGFKTFELQTTYPGLLIGTGYTHGTNLMGELKIGFYFDHTSGLPVIPGSSVKGLLRSMFPMQDRIRAAEALSKYSRLKEQKPDEAQKYLEIGNQYAESAEQKHEFIQELLPAEYKTIDTAKLECQIFGTANGDGNDKDSRGYDIFHDAILIKSQHPKQNGFPKGCFLADDYITPHKNTTKDGIPNALKNPKPISLLKVLPKVTFRFQFDMKNNYYVKDEEGRFVKKNFLLNAQARVDLFRSILTTVGIGAKTNVGYGQFTETGK